LHQLGELFLQAVPTVIIVFFFYLFMRWAFFTPILKAMAERDAKIAGARREAAAVEEAARRDLENYNEALRKARAEIYAEQEAARQAILEERAKNLKAMRSLARKEVEEAKKKIAAELASARAEVERHTPELAEEIVRSILENPLSLPGASGR
ncbi:MAG: ATP synthase F0 subunit B, partial [Candidatus Acidiferrales bacterium]